VHGAGSGETGTGLESTLRPAKRAAERVCGSAKMENELEVRVLNESTDEAELLGAVLQAPMLDNLVPSTVDPTVEDRGVTLAGSASWQFGRDEAEFQVGKALAVLDLLEEIDLNSPQGRDRRPQDRVQGCVRAQLEAQRRRPLGPDVERDRDSRGFVSWWSEHAAAVAAGWAAPGVPKVDGASWSSADRQDSAARGDAGRAAAYPREEQRDGIRAIP
jgi:hypothetical protein